MYRQTGDSYLPKFLDLLLRDSAYVAEYRIRSTGIRDSRLRLYPDEFLSIPLLRPRREEQERICAYIDQEDRRFSTLVTKARREIELMNEYRTALIAEAVTGKIDVREAETRSA